MPFLFENLKVYQKAVALSVSISKLTDTFPRGNYYLTDQLNRAALSISANIAEGHGRYHFNDRLRFCYYARGSLFETRSWLFKAIRRNLIKNISKKLPKQ